jgi:hypothetical protein
MVERRSVSLIGKEGLIGRREERREREGKGGEKRGEKGEVRGWRGIEGEKTRVKEGNKGRERGTGE